MQAFYMVAWLLGKKKAAWIGLWAGVRKPKFACSLMSGRGQARNRFAYARVYTYICSVYYVTTSSGGAGRRIWTTWRTDLLCSAVLYQTIYAETKTFPLYKQTDLWQSSLHIVCTWRLSCRQVWVFGKTICVGGGETNIISSEICTCTYRRRTPELKINKYKTWAWQGQKLHNSK